MPTVGTMPPRRERPEFKSRRRWGPGRWISLALTLVLVVAGGYLAWQYIGTNIVSKHKQQVLAGALQDDWADRSGNAADDKVALGDAIAILRVPRFGDDFEVPVVEGVGDEELKSGVGHFPDTQRPGQVGNFALAGHRITNGQPFSDFPDLRTGDKVTVETRTHLYTYVLDEDGDDREVDFTEIWVLDPVPGRPKADPQQELITLTTCAEIFHTDERSVAVGHLVSAKHL